MSFSIRTRFVCLIILLVSMPGFSQDAGPKKDAAQTVKERSKTKETAEESSRPAGVRKVATRSQYRDWDFDIHIDEEALETSIELAVENAMKSVEVVLERLEINIEPIVIDLGDLDIDADPIVINIPDLEINIEPIVVDLDDMDIDIDIDEDDSDWDDEDDDEDAFDVEEWNTDKDKLKEDKLKDRSKDTKDKDKSGKEEKDKSKGLKKIN